MSVAVIINPRAGGASPAQAGARAELVSTLLAARGEAADISITDRRGHAHDLALAAVGRGARLVIAWGGDGTINEIASALIFSNTALGIIPSGSGNGLARALRIDRRPGRAVREALDAVPRPIDAGEIAGRVFVNVAGVGFDAHVAACFDRAGGGRRGLSTYSRVTARELWGYRCGAYRVDGATDRRALLVTVANASQFGNGAQIAPAARLDDGRLDLVIVEERSRLATLIALPRLFVGGLERVAGVSMRQVTAVTIESDCPMVFHVDGEPVEGGTRLEARVLPSALRVAVR